jgi:hypothetical protein
MRKSGLLSLLIIIMMLLSSNAFAWDKERKGFILSLGGGGGVVTYKQTVSEGFQSIESDRENGFSFWTNFEIGYAPSNQIMILYSNVVPWFKMTNIYNSDVTMISGVGGPTITYYLQPSSPSFFIGGGFGLAVWQAPFESGNDAWTGIGLIAKAGYEFAKNVNFAVHILYGNPSKTILGVEGETNAVNIGFTVSWIGY